jgi:hypothetical protein
MASKSNKLALILALWFITIGAVFAYGTITGNTNGGIIGLEYDAECTEKCDKIVFIQVICYKAECDGQTISVKPGDFWDEWKYRNDKTVDIDGAFCSVDYIMGENDPAYNGDDSADQLPGNVQGVHLPPPPPPEVVTARMGDNPYVPDWAMTNLDALCPTGKTVKKVIFEFETCAVCFQGIEKGVNYGCIKWKYERSKGDSGDGTSTADGTSSTPSLKWYGAVAKWYNIEFVPPK